MKTTIDAAELLKAYRDNPEALLRDAHDTDNIDVAADYLSRGRSLRALGITELTERAAQAAATYGADLMSRDKLRALEDVQAEFRLRGLEPPLPSNEQLKVIFDHAIRVAEALLKAMDDPETQEDTLELLTKEGLGKLLKTLIDPKSKN